MALALLASALAYPEKGDRFIFRRIAHGDLEHEQALIRKSVLSLLSGQSALKMDVASFPLNEEIAKAQVALQNSMTEAFAGRGALNVIVKNDGAAS